MKRRLLIVFFLTVQGLWLQGCVTPSIALPPRSRLPMPTGKGSQSSISRVVMSNFDDIKNCYDNALQKDPRLTGKVIVEFSVEPGEPPKPIKIKESTLQNRELDQCILAQFRKWHFPQEKGARSEVVLTYPLELGPETK